MNILYLIGSLGNGGKERLVRDVLEKRNDLPFKAWCVCRKTPADCDGAILLPSKHLLRFLFRLRKTVQNKKIDIIHSQSSFDTLLARLSTIGLNTIIVQTLHTYEFAKKTKYKILERLAFSASTQTIFVSNEQMRHFSEAHRLTPRQVQKQTLIYNGVNFERFATTPAPKTGKERPQVAMVGNFVPAKDQLFVCQFVKELCSMGQPIDFYFIGERKHQFPHCYDKCVNYCSEHHLADQVHFLGRRDDVPEILSQMDAFVYCSKSETFGIAVVEAIATGIPTFVNNLPVFDEITQSGRLAHLFSTESTQGLTQQFKDFLAHRQDHLDAAAQNATIIRSTYSITTHIANLHSLYSNVLN